MPKRVRVKRGSETTSLTTKQKVELNMLLDEIAKNMEEQEHIKQELKKQMPLLEKKIKEYGQKDWETDNALAEMFQPAQRTTQVVDVTGFRNEVSEEDFMNSISVTLKNAKQVLSEKELARITTMTKSAKKPRELKVTLK